MDVHISNIDTQEQVIEFKGVAKIEEGAIPGSLVLVTEKKNILIKLRDCDYIEFYN